MRAAAVRVHVQVCPPQAARRRHSVYVPGISSARVGAGQLPARSLARPRRPHSCADAVRRTGGRASGSRSPRFASDAGARSRTAPGRDGAHNGQLVGGSACGQRRLWTVCARERGREGQGTAPRRSPIGRPFNGPPPARRSRAAAAREAVFLSTTTAARKLLSRGAPDREGSPPRF